jgi:two-component system, OmpR family, sensor histidine kinase KdpD
MRNILRLTASLAGVGFVTIVYARVGVTNATTVALSFLLVVLVTASTSTLWIAVSASVAAMLCFNFFFLPPVGAWTIEDPQNWVALFTFLAVSVVASNLSSAVRARAQEALERRDEMSRLFDLSRDVLLMTDSREALATLAHSVARQFHLGYAAVCLPRDASWDVFEAGSAQHSVDRSQLSLPPEATESGVESNAGVRAYQGHRVIHDGEQTVRLIPLRVGARYIGILAVSGRPVEGGTLDALAGLVAIAVDRIQLLDERKAAELARQSEALKSALLASLGHDLRTPLTTIRVAAGNLRSAWPSEDDRRVQSGLILTEVERLTRLFQNILDMAKLDAGAVAAERRWVYPAEVVDAARSQVEHALHGRRVNVTAESDRLVRMDPRLTAAALAHLLENAVQYSPPDTVLDVDANVSAEGLTLSVRDHGPGIAPQDLPRLFERFFRGETGAHRTSGTGMGLSIARGVLAVEQGRVWAENCEDGGARFTIVVPGDVRTVDSAEVSVG